MEEAALLLQSFIFSICKTLHGIWMKMLWESVIVYHVLLQLIIWINISTTLAVFCTITVCFFFHVVFAHSVNLLLLNLYWLFRYFLYCALKWQNKQFKLWSSKINIKILILLIEKGLRWRFSVILWRLFVFSLSS